MMPVRRSLVRAAALLAGVAPLGLAHAATLAAPAQIDGRGPYNLTTLAGGIGSDADLTGDAKRAATGDRWSIQGWLKIDVPAKGEVVVAALGTGADRRILALDDGHLLVRGGGVTVRSAQAMAPGRLTAIGVSADGHRVTLFVDGRQVAARAGTLPPVVPHLALAPVLAGQPHFGGTLIDFAVLPEATSVQAFADAAKTPPDPTLVAFQKPGQGWDWQEHQWRGLFQPQDPATLPTANTPPSHPVAEAPTDTAPLSPLADHRWQIGGWQLAAAPDVKGDGAAISQARFDSSKWYAATVPGTVLTTLVARGVYPDPAYGLNNFAIPEKLSREDWWYRAGFDLPAEDGDRHHYLLFKGINYAAEIWVNGRQVGTLKGAFIRGQFDVTRYLVAGHNTIAVRIAPPPHPGIPDEESIARGPGGNGGQLALDGPTFVATEGWDWIPGVRDRDIGLWQPVELRSIGAVHIGDPQVVTKLPLPATDSADVTITVPVVNDGDAPVATVVTAAFEGVSVSRTVTAPPGTSEVVFAPAAFGQLHVAHPRLWWPNGYGAQNLYTLTATATVGGAVSDSETRRFGMREMSYGLSLFAPDGQLRRVVIDPTMAHQRHEDLVALTHLDIKQTPTGWAESLTAAGAVSPAVKDVPAEMPEPHLTIYVNGVRIAARGGNWGMDDFMKRVSRARLEPYFRLHKDANINIIRNWVGQNTEDVFYDLADEYGMLILNDFWESTQEYQNEAEDPALLLRNAADVIARYRNHPSIAVWFGRNEGVPQPILNEGLDRLVQSLDGTRFYTGSSNRIGLQGSGPYNYRPPVGYFTDLATGFSVETGTPSLATLEAVKAMVPPADRWPISDTLAYHDWHIGGNGDVKTFMDALDAQLGAPTSLEDFERKAQMFNYVDYRAIFEGFNAHLWTKNSGRLLWMTQPAWPSNHWEILSHDYDTQASFYGVKSALEPVHVQLNLPDFAIAVANTTRDAAPGLTMRAHVVDLAGRTLLDRSETVSAPANQTTTLKPLALQPLLDAHGLVLVELTLVDSGGRQISRNVYWQGKDDAAYRALTTMPQQAMTASVRKIANGGVAVTLSNDGTTPLLETKLTLVDAQGERVLPAFYSDNYVSLLPGEHRTVTIDTMDSAKPAGTPAAVQLRGWNVTPASIPIG
ncbi:sugar-binding domain-containing protein [uncultured Sphingomonas sp.]|uniref:glycosyl hydrolase 2 galactose-binding domain-containing protein n=1 Tax=uncultured Sphingomonas sp. TaxID=158754 RepID=UPI0026289DE6|nr:sugar-binding domain-containing protein [uncultured Sphingomonas sp.]